MQTVRIEIHQTAAEAPDYNTNGQGFKAAHLDKAVVVKNGTEQGNPTIDLQLVCNDGSRCVVMITARLLASIVAVAYSGQNDAPNTSGLN